MVEAQTLSKVFRAGGKDEVRAVDEVSFCARPGQITGLLGVNGAGKTTLMRLLSTVLRPTGGSGTVQGYNILTQAADVRQNLGFLSTSTALYGRLTGREMVDTFAGLYGYSGAERKTRVDRALARVDAEPFCERLCDTLSTGQKQRISIARALVHDPPVLLFDEPTAGLDILSAQTVLEFMESARAEGRTVILSTHIMSEVERLCDHVVVVHGGIKRAEGSTEALKALTGFDTMERAFLSLVRPTVEVSA